MDNRTKTVQILTYLEEYAVSDSISSIDPIPWCFRYVSEYECDDNSPKSSIQVSWGSTDWEMIQESQESEQKTAQELAEKYLPVVDKKFQGYSNCLKVLVVEMCGNPLTLPSLDKITQIIKKANIPISIDQIWLAVTQNELDTSITYHRVI